jgi:hypothetical protein
MPYWFISYQILICLKQSNTCDMLFFAILLYTYTQCVHFYDDAVNHFCWWILIGGNFKMLTFNFIFIGFKNKKINIGTYVLRLALNRNRYNFIFFFDSLLVPRYLVNSMYKKYSTPKFFYSWFFSNWKWWFILFFSSSMYRCVILQMS